MINKGSAVLAIRNARDSLWLVPALLVAAAFALSTGLLYVDARAPELTWGRWLLFPGNASAARTVLSVIAGSLISVIAVIFSVTMNALQQASTQFTPRVLRNFTRDLGNQLVLGTFFATCAAWTAMRSRTSPREGSGSPPYRSASGST